MKPSLNLLIYPLILQEDALALFLFIIVLDYLLKKRTQEIESEIATYQRQSRRYPDKVLRSLDSADDIDILESTLNRARVQLPRIASVAEDV